MSPGHEDRTLILLELAVVVAFVVADIHRLVPFSKVPFFLLLAWVSLRLRGLRFRDVGLRAPRSWRSAMALGTLAGLAMELSSIVLSQPALERLFGRPADLSDLRPLVGNATILALALALNWLLAALGEELVFRGYLMPRVAALGGGGRAAWAVSLLLVSGIFGWGHVDQGVTGQIQAGLDGFLLGGLYLACGRTLAVPIVAHGISNTLALVLVYLGRYPGI